jgi:hypothetical protein
MPNVSFHRLVPILGLCVVALSSLSWKRGETVEQVAAPPNKAAVGVQDSLASSLRSIND